MYARVPPPITAEKRATPVCGSISVAVVVLVSKTKIASVPPGSTRVKTTRLPSVSESRSCDEPSRGIAASTPVEKR